MQQATGQFFLRSLCSFAAILSGAFTPIRRRTRRFSLRRLAFWRFDFGFPGRSYLSLGRLDPARNAVASRLRAGQARYNSHSLHRALSQYSNLFVVFRARRRASKSGCDLAI